MPTVGLAKPGTVSAELLETSGTLNVGASGTRVYYIKVATYDLRFNPGRLEETTGDEDPHPTYEASAYFYGTVLLSGFVTSGQAIGLQNLSDTAAADTELTISINFSSARRLSFRCKIAEVHISGLHRGPFVRISMSFLVSDMTAAQVLSIESAVIGV